MCQRELTLNQKSPANEREIKTLNPYTKPESFYSTGTLFSSADINTNFLWASNRSNPMNSKISGFIDEIRITKLILNYLFDNECQFAA